MSGIEIIATLAPKNDAAFATHDSQYGRGGWHEAATLVDRDAIPAGRRRAGMAVNVLSEGKVYQLAGDLATWVEISMGGSGGGGIAEAPIDGDGYVRSLADWKSVGDYLDGGVLI